MFLPREWVLLKLETLCWLLGFLFFFFSMRPFDVNPLTSVLSIIHFFRMLFISISCEYSVPSS